MTDKLKEIFQIFLKLGFVAFGGPAAHVSMMHDEFVERRKWMTGARFTSLLGITNLIPGPNSTEMAMLCGYERGGFKGYIIAGMAFIAPAMLLTIALAFLYTRYNSLPEIQPVLLGLQAGVVTVIIHAVYKLAKKSLNGKVEYAVLLLAVVMSLFLLDEITVIVLSGGIMILLLFARDKMFTITFPAFIGLFALKAFTSQKTSSIFLFFLKIGLVLFGSGYVLVAYLDAYLVQDLGWLSREALLDAIAMGQFTPGPVLTTASFIGYLLNGVWGAIAATVGIFLPSFIFVGLIHPLVEKINRIPSVGQFITGAGIGALGVMAVVAFDLVREGVGSNLFLIVLLVSALYQFGMKKANTILTIVGSIALSFLLYYFGL